MRISICISFLLDSEAVQLMAASSSSQRIMEKAVEKPGAGQKKEPKNLHVAQPHEIIEKLKNTKDSGQRSFQWAYDEKQLQQVWEWQSEMSFQELLSHVIYGEGEEVVWDDDVFGVQQNKEISQPQPQVSVEKFKDN